MSWVGIACLIFIILVFMAIVATHCRAYSQGYRDGVQCERELSYKCKDEAELEE